MSLRDKIIEEFYSSYRESENGKSLEDHADDILALPEIANAIEWYERELRVQEIAKKIGWGQEKFTEKVIEWKEKAEKWDMIPIGDGDYFQRSIYWHEEYENTRNKLDLLMSSLMVREKCHKCFGDGKTNYYSTHVGKQEKCRDCHGTGYITRPATVEEVGEFINDSFGPTHRWASDTEWQLKSGVILFMKGKE